MNDARDGVQVAGAERPCYLSAAEVRERLAGLDVLAAMRSLFLSLGRGEAVQPPQTLTLFPDGAGDFITYAGVLTRERVFGLKVSPYIVTDAKPIVAASTLLLSMRTGAPLLYCDSSALTIARTAATTALAVDLLARADARTLAVVGSGPVGLAHLSVTLPLRAWQRVRIWSLDLPGAADALRPKLASLDREVTIAASCADAVRDADVVMLCTSAGTPVLDVAALSKPALITSITTNAPRAHEVAPKALFNLDVYCDYRVTTPSTAGEMILAQEQGWSPGQIRGDLGELVTGRAPRPDYARSCFFRSVGLGLEDVQMALELYRRLS